MRTQFRKTLMSAFAALGLFAAATPAMAQFSANSGQDTILDADDIVSSKGVITLTGQADIRQGDVRLLADKVQIYTAGNNGGGAIASTSEIDRVVATGNFYYITADQEVRGEKGVFTQSDNNFVVTGNVILLQDDSVITGDRLIYNLDTEQARVVSDCKGRRCGQRKRVRVLIKNTNGSQNES